MQDVLETTFIRVAVVVSIFMKHLMLTWIIRDPVEEESGRRRDDSNFKS